MRFPSGSVRLEKNAANPGDVFHNSSSIRPPIVGQHNQAALLTG
jgi:hypothetical protein